MTWIKFDNLIVPYPAQIPPTYDCRYAREYVPNSGFNGGPTNSNILNFKKSISQANTPAWQHRDNAVRLFGSELATAFLPTTRIYVTNIPTSKPRNDPQYDRRFEDLFACLKHHRPLVDIFYPLDIQTAQTPTHLGGTRNAATLQANLVLTSFPAVHPDRIVLVDDIVTSGSHFKACADFLQANGYNGQIIGLFWARTI